MHSMNRCRPLFRKSVLGGDTDSVTDRNLITNTMSILKVNRNKLTPKVYANSSRACCAIYSRDTAIRACRDPHQKSVCQNPIMG